eukprot:gene124-5491_t
MVDPIAAILEALPRIRTRVLDDTTILRRTTILTASMDTSAMVDPIAAILEALPRIRTNSTNTIRYGRLYWDQKAQCSAQQNGSGSVTGREGALPDPLIGPYDGWVDGVYSLEMGVRDYELDQFGVVNNAVYANYFQHARHEGLERLGIDCDAYARANLGLAITDMRLSYKAPLRSKDKFRVLTGVSRVTGARAVMDEVILRSVTNGDGEEKDMVIAKCQVTLVVLDGGYNATRLPAAIKDVFTTVMQEAISITRTLDVLSGAR